MRWLPNSLLIYWFIDVATFWSHPDMFEGASWPLWLTDKSPFSLVPATESGTCRLIGSWSWHRRQWPSVVSPESTRPSGPPSATRSPLSIRNLFASRWNSMIHQIKLELTAQPLYSRPASKLTRGKKVKSGNFAGLVTVSGYRSDWTRPSGSSTPTIIVTCRMWTSNLTFRKCSVFRLCSCCPA